ncbi:class I SAM-dependent methyltransferase [Lacinutrix mariniflava]|uniref:class I SAM-dependent methyltransferase n=1 Tax=Lacinutrix mariniflava TaxID=342955 RepID=UPI0006E301A8|nr:class I SAM-dependent methyltransferase [Lacinutrix mariniflava]
MESEKYVHTAKIHNMTAPKIIVDLCLKLIKPTSVVDFGCGIGTFLKAFKEKGITDVLGMDGSWVNREMLQNFLSEKEFKEANLEEPILLDKKYDLAISLEVAEHLKESAAETFIENLVNSSDMILFSAAIPHQGGQNHINEQWFDYWLAKFHKQGFEVLDVFRAELWNKPQVNWWYKQNIFLLVKKEKIGLLELKSANSIQNCIHPEHYLEKINEHKNFRLGKGRVKMYLKLLFKSILYKLKLI